MMNQQNEELIVASEVTDNVAATPTTTTPVSFDNSGIESQLQNLSLSTSTSTWSPLSSSSSTFQTKFDDDCYKGTLSLIFQYVGPKQYRYIACINHKFHDVYTRFLQLKVTIAMVTMTMTVAMKVVMLLETIVNIKRITTLRRPSTFKFVIPKIYAINVNMKNRMPPLPHYHWYRLILKLNEFYKYWRPDMVI